MMSGELQVHWYLGCFTVLSRSSNANEMGLFINPNVLSPKQVLSDLQSNENGT